MRYVCYEEALGVCFVRRDAHGAASTVRVYGCVVYAHVDGVVIVAGQPAAVGCGCGCELDEAAGWVGPGEEGEVLEEVGVVVGVFEGIGAVCYACKANGGCAEAREKGCGMHYSQSLVLNVVWKCGFNRIEMFVKGSAECNGVLEQDIERC